MLSVSDLFIYPIKSLGGVSLPVAQVTDRGLLHDRRWMLVDNNNEFMSQRSIAAMALLQVEVGDDGLHVSHKKTSASTVVPFDAQGQAMRVKVWSDMVKALEVQPSISEWFSDMLHQDCKLVYMPDTSRRRVDSRYASNKEITSFSDAYPFLLIGQSSLDDLNQRLPEPVPMNRFRPNIVVTGSSPFEEDEWAQFAIRQTNFFGVKLCARCVVTTIHQDEALPGKEPLRTLATYRSFNKKVYFGQNLVHHGEGIIKVGDEVEVTERKKPRFPRD